jgi:hypothetical protein
MSLPVPTRLRLDEVLHSSRAMARLLRRNNTTRYLGEQIEARLFQALRPELADGAGRPYWEVALPTIEVPADEWQHVQPDGAEPLLVVLDDFYSEWYVTDQPEDYLAPIRTADLHVVVQGRLMVEAQEIVLADHWRIEAHQYIGSDKSSSAHPRFHLQRGGWRASEFERTGTFIPGWPHRRVAAPVDAVAESRGFMICPAPRIAQPPMDPVVAIDFAISHYHGPVWRELWDIAEYAELVARRQTALWGPFFARLAQLSSSIENGFWPQYFGPTRA